MKDIFSDNNRAIQKVLELNIYQRDTVSANEIYTRYQSGTGVVLIIKKSIAGTVETYEKTFDTWANRATATYVAIDVDIT